MKCMRTFNFQKIFKRAFKFTVYGRKHSRIHTHLHNAVPACSGLPQWISIPIWMSLGMSLLLFPTVYRHKCSSVILSPTYTLTSCLHGNHSENNILLWKEKAFSESNVDSFVTITCQHVYNMYTCTSEESLILTWRCSGWNKFQRFFSKLGDVEMRLNAH